MNDTDKLSYINYLVTEDIEYYEKEIAEPGMKKDGKLETFYRGKLDALKEIKYFLDKEDW